MLMGASLLQGIELYTPGFGARDGGRSQKHSVLDEWLNSGLSESSALQYNYPFVLAVMIIDVTTKEKG